MDEIEQLKRDMEFLIRERHNQIETEGDEG
jgi:hypothetical protein